MKERLRKKLSRILLSITSILIILTMNCAAAYNEPVTSKVSEPIDISETLPEFELRPEKVEIREPYTLNGNIVTTEEIELIATLTMAEAEGECELGKRLVIDTVLNRVEGEYWPDTIREVIYQPAQYSPVWGSRMERCYPREDIVELVKDELWKRTNSEVIFFRTKRYSDYGVPMFKVEHHYFSKYE